MAGTPPRGVPPPRPGMVRIDKDEFVATLRMLLDPKDTVRNRGEEIVERWKKSMPVDYVTALFVCASRGPDKGVRHMATVLLRQTITHDEVWSVLPKDCKNALKESLMSTLNAEPDFSIRRLTCDVVGELGMLTLEDGEWNELLPSLYNMVREGDDAQRRSALITFERLAYFVATKLESKFTQLRDMLAHCITDAKSPPATRVQAARTAGQIVIAFEKGQSSVDIFTPLSKSLLALLQACMSSNDGSLAELMLSVHTDIAGIQPHFYRAILVDAQRTMLAIASERRRYPDGMRRLGLEWCVALAESSPVLVRTIPDNGFITSVIPVVLQMLTEVQEDDQWEDRDPVHEGDELNNVSAASEVIDRLVDKVGKERVLSVVMPTSGAMVKSRDWRERYAALTAISYACEAFPKDREKFMSTMSSIARFVEDPHPRVRWAAYKAFELFCYWVGKPVVRSSHRVMIPAFLKGLADPSKRVQAQTASALVCFAESCKKDVLAEHLDPLLRLLYRALVDGARYVREQALTAISGLAEHSEEKFSAFYDRLMPVCADILTARITPDQRALRGKAMECASMLGSVVPVEKFRPDAARLMTLLTGMPPMSNDDPQRYYMRLAYGRIASVLKREFEPYLKRVVPELLEGVTTEVHAEYVSMAEAQGAPETEYLHLSESEGKVLRVRTADLDECAVALRMLTQIMNSCGPAFVEYLPELGRVASSVVQKEGEAYAPLRTFALQAFACMIDCAKEAKAPREVIANICAQSVRAMLQTLTLRLEADALKQVIQTIRGVIVDCSEVPIQLIRSGEVKPPPTWDPDSPLHLPVLEPKLLRALAHAMRVLMTDALQRRAARVAEAKVYDFDKEAKEELDRANDFDEDIMWNCVYVNGLLAEAHRGMWLPIFKEFYLDIVEEWSHPVRIPSDRTLALYLMDDVLEHGGPGAAEYVKNFSGRLIEASREGKTPEVVQAGVYGLGVTTMSLAPAFAPATEETAKVLVMVEAKTRKSSDKWQKVHDNAVCALGKLIQTQKLDLETYVPMWIGGLPLRGDLIESGQNTKIICSRIEKGCPITLGCLPQILRNFAYMMTLDREFYTEYLAQRMRAAVGCVRRNMPPDDLRRILASLPDATRVAIDKLMSAGGGGGGGAGGT